MTQVSAGQELGDREAQEDAVTVAPQAEDGSHLLILADGMGGHAGGQVASNLAAQTFRHHFEEVSENLRPSGRLHEALLRANDAIAEEVENNPELAKMGCTLLAVLVAAGRIAWISVGDSPLFLLRNGKIERLTADHSYFGELMEMVGRGEMTEAEARSHPRKNALRSVLNGEPLSLIDNKVTSLESGDVFLLASDGLETLTDQEIASIALQAQSQGADAIRDALLDAVVARKKPKQDNTSLIVVAHGSPNLATKPNLAAKVVAATEINQSFASARNLLVPGLIGVAAFAGALLLWLALFQDRSDSQPTVAPRVDAEPTQPPQGATPIDEGDPEVDEGGAEIRTLPETGPNTGETPDIDGPLPDGGSPAPEDGGAANPEEVEGGPAEGEEQPSSDEAENPPANAPEETQPSKGDEPATPEPEGPETQAPQQTNIVPQTMPVPPSAPAVGKD